MAMKVVLDLRWAELQVRVKHVGFQTHRRDLLREVLCRFVHMHTSTWDGVLRRAITVINLHDMLAPPQRWCSVLAVQFLCCKKFSRASLATACKNCAPQLWSALSWRGSSSVPVSSIFSQRTYAAGLVRSSIQYLFTAHVCCWYWTVAVTLLSAKFCWLRCWCSAALDAGSGLIMDGRHSVFMLYWQCPV